MDLKQSHSALTLPSDNAAAPDDNQAKLFQALSSVIPFFCCCKRAARPGFLCRLIHRRFVSGTPVRCWRCQSCPRNLSCLIILSFMLRFFQIFCCCKTRAFPERQRGARWTALRCCLLIMDSRMCTFRLGMGNEAENSLLTS